MERVEGLDDGRAEAYSLGNEDVSLLQRTSLRAGTGGSEREHRTLSQPSPGAASVTRTMYMPSMTLEIAYSIVMFEISTCWSLVGCKICMVTPWIPRTASAQMISARSLRIIS
jgi:hypothetical protein